MANPTLRDRFMANVIQGDTEDDCWRWTGSKHRYGYGRINSGGRNGTAHAVSYELFNGPIPKGLYILHKCNNPECANPRHLRAGTQKENGADMVKAGHSTAGTKNKHAKLTEKQVQEIYNSNEQTHLLMKQFNVCRAHNKVHKSR